MKSKKMNLTIDGVHLCFKVQCTFDNKSESRESHKRFLILKLVFPKCYTFRNLS